MTPIEQAKFRLTVRHIIADNIRTFRNKMGLTQTQLGEMIGVSNQSILSWETPRTTPPVERLAMLSKVFGITLDELVLQQHEVEIRKGEHA